MVEQGFQEIYRIFQKGAIEILILLRNNPENYNSIMSLLKIKNISKSWSAVKIKDLLKNKLIAREIVNETPPKTNYSLTEKGNKILDLILEISRRLFAE